MPLLPRLRCKRKSLCCAGSKCLFRLCLGLERQPERLLTTTRFVRTARQPALCFPSLPPPVAFAGTSVRLMVVPACVSLLLRLISFPYSPALRLAKLPRAMQKLAPLPGSMMMSEGHLKEHSRLEVSMAAAAAATSAGGSRIWTTAEWAALKAHAEAMEETHLRDLLDVSCDRNSFSCCAPQLPRQPRLPRHMSPWCAEPAGKWIRTGLLRPPVCRPGDTRGCHGVWRSRPRRRHCGSTCG